MWGSSKCSFLKLKKIFNILYNNHKIKVINNLNYILNVIKIKYKLQYITCHSII